MRIGFIGATSHYGGALRSAAGDPELDIAGAAPGSTGESLDGMQRLAAELDVALATSESVEELLDEGRPDVVVVDCHYGDQAEAAIAAMERGVHVYINKPMATTLADLERLKEVHRESGVELTSMIGGTRYSRSLVAAKQAVDDGAVGEIRLLSGQKSYRLGRRPDFYRNRQRHGGTLLWVGIYPVAWFTWVSGLAFREVRAAHSRRGNRGYGDLEVAAAMQFVMDREVLAVAHLDYFRPAGAPSHGDDRLRVAGTAGVLDVRGGRVTLLDARGERELPLAAPEGSLFRDFLGQIRGEGRCRLSAAEAFALTEAVLKARQAADDSGAVRF